MIIKAKYIAVFLFVSISAGCCMHYPMNPDYNGPLPLPETIKKEYEYKKFTGEYQVAILEKKEEYIIKQIEFAPSHNILPTTHNVTVDYYDINKKKSPVIMVLPILGGSNKIAKSFADYFARHGYAAVIVHRQKEYKKLEQINKLDETLRQIVFDHKQAIDWIMTQENLDSEKIGIFGVSMGGIKSSLVSALDSRISASVMVLAAGDLPYILTYSREKGIIKRRKKIMAQENLRLDEFHRKLQRAVKCDPINYAEYLDARKVLMVLAKFDNVVPYRKGKELGDKIGKPETIVLFSGHYTAIPFIFYVKKKSLQFFRKKFGFSDQIVLKQKCYFKRCVWENLVVEHSYRGVLPRNIAEVKGIPGKEIYRSGHLQPEFIPGLLKLGIKSIVTLSSVSEKTRDLLKAHGIRHEEFDFSSEKMTFEG
ncbi:MAG: hypothetical protein GY749_10075, partial [Desulfobacteraceae bacterium]|nr:hypothetical protein [Desulfobacteraceae bacterium]